MQYNFNWKSLSVAAGLTEWNFYFRLYPGAVKKAQVLDFLQALVRHLRLPLLVVWDRLPAHRSRLVQDYIADLEGWVHQGYLPPYAPGTEPGGIHLGLLEAARTAERLSQGLPPTQ